MVVILSDEDCVNIVKYVFWLEHRLEEEAGCYSSAVKEEITEEFNIYKMSLDKVIMGQVR